MSGKLSAQGLKQKAVRFRVLIIGRANSGKTTILKKICNTTDNPVVYNERGQRISSSALTPTQQRGMHEIENEIIFRSSPGFVFHDSRGFEAGGVDEMKKVKAFILKRSKAKSLQDQVHVIWYCIPMDSARPVTHAEAEFFSRSGTGKVPVVVIFTKCEALEVTALSALQQEGYSFNQAMVGAPGHARDILDTVHREVEMKKYPPQAYVCFRELNQDHTTCRELVKHTAAILTDENLQALFISTQQNNLELAMEYSIRQVIKKAIQAGPRKWPGELVQIVFSHFPYHVSIKKII